MKKENEALENGNVELKKSVLPMVLDTDKIVMKYGKPHKAVMMSGREFYEEIEWEQIPKYRHAELKKVLST